MDAPRSNQKKRKPEKWLVLKLAIIVVSAVVVTCVGVAKFTQYKRQMDMRSAFIEQVVKADSFDKLGDQALLLPRADGTWVVIKSETGWQTGNWTLAVDSEGKWLETNDASYKLMSEVWDYKATIKKDQEIRSELDSTVDTDTRTNFEKWMKDNEENRHKCYPNRIKSAATLAEARAILHTMGFHDVVGIPVPRMAGIATQPAATAPVVAPSDNPESVPSFSEPTITRQNAFRQTPLGRNESVGPLGLGQVYQGLPGPPGPRNQKFRPVGPIQIRSLSAILIHSPTKIPISEYKFCVTRKLTL